MPVNKKLTVQEKELIRDRLKQCISRIQCSDDVDEVNYMFSRAFKHLLDLASDNIQRIWEDV